MPPNLCELCRQFDVRKLLLDSQEQKPTLLSTNLTGLQSLDQEWTSGLPTFFRHQKTLSDLQTSAQNGCELCNLMWELWSASPHSNPKVDQQIDLAGKGQLFIGTSSSNISKGQSPSIIVTQRPENESPRTLCNLEIFANPNSKPSQECKWVGRPVSSNPKATECQDIARGWYTECLERHSACKTNKTLRRPTRLINVGLTEPFPNPVLELDTSHHGTAPFVALSYCWGGQSDFILTKDLVEQLTSGIPLEKWPGTLHDAILITRSLHIQYLWIDALCIFQDSKDDWVAEAARMRDVYSGAAITILASNAVSTGAGVLKDRIKKVELPACELPWGAEDPETVFVRSASLILSNSAYNNPLQKRGWTLQEGLLSPRTLSFCSDQLVWECASLREDECGHKFLLDHKYDSKDLLHSSAPKSRTKAMAQDSVFKLMYYGVSADRQLSRFGLGSKYLSSSMTQMEDSLGVNPYDRWADIIAEFSRRSLTQDMDMLPALAGIARAFAAITKDVYVVGMWKTELINQLCWWKESKAVFEFQGKGPDRFLLTKPETYRAPSWSWAGFNGGVVWMSAVPINGDTPLQSITTILKVNVEPADTDEFGQIKHAYLDLKGSVFPLDNLKQDFWGYRQNGYKVPQPSGPDLVASKIDGKGEDVQWSGLSDYVQNHLNTKISAAFEFEQQHIPHAGQRFYALLLALTEGVNRITPDDVVVGGANIMLLETTGSNANEYRRVGILSFQRPGYAMEQIDPEIAFKESKDLKLFSGKDKTEFERRFPDEVLEYGAWMEVAKCRPKRTTIRVI
ncbi:heterokaryon incompatibility protein-domain-containing protein [Tricladium varicosporioides]|nr:heterokaryon incompatibility protein-domain-containing protein [Hymenoscyphus varicosporioides]